MTNRQTAARNKQKGESLSDPAYKLVAVSPHNSTAIAGGPTRALWVGTGGDVVILAADDSATVTLANVPDGTLLPIATTRVHSTGTTASDLVGLL